MTTGMINITIDYSVSIHSTILRTKRSENTQRDFLLDQKRMLFFLT